MTHKFRMFWLLAAMAGSLACSGALLMPTATAADSDTSGEKKTRQLSILFPKYQDYLELAEERQMHFAPVYRLAMPEGDLSKLEVSFEFEGKTYHVSPDAEGIVGFRPSRAMLKADPDLKVKNAVGQMSLTLQMELLAGLRLRYDMEDLHKQNHEAWSEAKKLGGFLSMFAPKHARMMVVFDESCPEARWTVTAADESEVASGVAEKGAALINFKDKPVRHARELTLSCVPKRLLLNP